MVVYLQAKHEPSCIKAAHKKRKVFDSSKQRSEGTEITYKQIKQAQKKVRIDRLHNYVPYIYQFNFLWHQWIYSRLAVLSNLRQLDGLLLAWKHYLIIGPLHLLVSKFSFLKCFEIHLCGYFIITSILKVPMLINPRNAISRRYITKWTYIYSPLTIV